MLSDASNAGLCVLCSLRTDVKNDQGHSVFGTEIHGAGDVEGHLGLDGKYYVVDFSRCLPPEAPTLTAAQAIPKYSFSFCVSTFCAVVFFHFVGCVSRVLVFCLIFNDPVQCYCLIVSAFVVDFVAIRPAFRLSVIHPV